MNILGLDCSGKTAGVCIIQNGAVTYYKMLNEGLTHSETLLPLIQNALEETNLSPAAINLYAVTHGPGSFTGLRIGLALVKGLAFAHNTPVLPVSTLWAAAASYDTLNGVVIPALDARRGEVYWAAFRCENGACHRLTPDTAGNAGTIESQTALFQNQVFFVGDGADICYTIFNCVQKSLPEETLLFPRTALGAARLALLPGMQKNILPAKDAAPQYLRLSQAERERNARLRGTTLKSK